MAETGPTLSADLITPDIWADAVAPVILGRTVWAQLATVDDQLAGQPGERVIFPKWDYIGDAEHLTEGVAMDVTKMGQSDSYAEIVEAGKAVSLTDTALLTAIGDPNNQAQAQIAIAVARRIDTDLRLAAEITETYEDTRGTERTSAPLKVATTADRFGWAAYVAGIALLGDEYDPSDLAGIVIHSAQYNGLLLDPNFLSADRVGAGNTVIQRGVVGSIAGVPILLSDRVTKTGTGADTVYNAVVVKRGALALKYKRRPIVEKDRDILTRMNYITTNVHYATKRVDDRGVVIIPTKALAPTGA